MSTIQCLSLPTNLRCEALSQVESIVFLVPPVLEVIFSLILIVKRWDVGARHLFLAFEGFAFLILALLDFFAHLLPEARENLEVFKIIDIAIGAGALIPPTLYLGFISSLTISFMIPNLPKRLQMISKYTLLLLIPVIALLVGIASLTGISYRAFLGTNGLPIIAVGFADSDAQTEWTVFSSIALATFTVGQAVNFCVAFHQLVRAFVEQRHIEKSGRQDDEIHLIKGVGWMSLGIKLGAIESVVGFAMFAHGGFAVALTRRIVRLVGRGCLVIGVIMGVDTIEDFDIWTKDRPRPPSRLQISNPRLSTFRRLSHGFRDTAMNSPTESMAEQIKRADREAYQRFGGSRRSGVPFPSKSRHSSLVTVRQEPGAPPVMDMRFTPLVVPGVPSPETIARSTQARLGWITRYSFGGTPIFGTPRNSPPDDSLTASQDEQSLPTPTFAPPSPVHPPPRAVLPPGPSQVQRPIITFNRPGNATSVANSMSVYSTATSGISGGRYDRSDNPYINPPGRTFAFGARKTPRESVMSASSIASDSLEVVREISEQFPGLPPRVTGKYRGSLLGRPAAPEDPWLARGMRPKHDTLASVAEESRTVTPDVVVSGSAQVSRSDSLEENNQSTQSIGSKRKPAPVPTPSPGPSPMSAGFRESDDGMLSPGFSPNQSSYLKPTSKRTTRTFDTRGSRLDMPWLENDTNAEIMVEGRAELEEAWWKTEAGLEGLKRSSMQPDTPSLGQVRSRMTPTVTTSTFTRDSEYVLHDDIPDLPQFSTVQSNESEAVRPGSPVRDSQVLGMV